LLVIEDGEILRLGLHAFHRYHEQLAVATLAKGPLEFASLWRHQSSPSLFSVRQGLVKAPPNCHHRLKIDPPETVFRTHPLCGTMDI
jgi:hypothetical protein